MTNTTYFYCYSPRLKAELNAAGIRFICVGLNESTGRKFWLFEQTDDLSSVIAAFKFKQTRERN